MLRLFVCVMRNEDGFTAAECGILGCLTVIFAEKFIAPFFRIAMSLVGMS